jgi:hypothetical protein
MIQPIFALLTRSLNLEAFRVRTYLTRSTMLMILLGMVLAAHLGGGSGAPGRQLFIMIMSANLFFLSLGAAFYVSTAISEEKDEFMLGLLRMTELGPLSILVGKGLARTSGMAALVLVQTPFTCAAMILGGVSTAQIAAAYATVLSYLLLLTGLGLFCSVVAPRSTSAAGLTFVMALLFLLGPFGWSALSAPVTAWLGLAPWVLSIVAGADAFAGFLKSASPFMRLEEIVQTGFAGPVIGGQVAADLAIGAAFFLLSWLTFDFFNREQRSEGPARGFLVGRARRFRLLAPGAAWRAPLVWKDFYFVTGGALMALVRFIAYGLVIAGVMCFAIFAKKGIYRVGGDYWLVGFLTASLLLLVELSYYASAVFNTEIRWRTYSVLAMLPMPTYRIAARKTLGCLLGAAPACLYVAVFGLPLLPRIESPLMLFILANVALQVVLFVHLIALLSLYMKHGAIVVATLIWWLGFGGFSRILAFPLDEMVGDAGGGSYALRVANAALLLGMILYLQRRILARLEALRV